MRLSDRHFLSFILLNVSSVTRKSTFTIFSGGHYMEDVTLITAYLSTWRPPWGPELRSYDGEL